MRTIIVSLFAVILAASAFADEGGNQRAVLVTGASSGIGLAIAERLADEGFYVYAGARKDRDLAMLDAMDNVSAVRLDVTDAGDIAAAVEFVEKQGRGLWGVINNAGVAVFSPMNETPEEDIDFVFDVNVYGPYRVNKAFAPMLVESGGRTTTIGSISGYIAGPQGGTYSMSKFAIEAYTDSYAAEMGQQGVHVSVIDPGGYRSEIREKVTLHALGKDEAEMSEEELEQLETMRARNAELKPPYEVAEAALDVMASEAPKRRYMVTPNAEQAETTIRAALGKVAQLNRDQPYEYSRDELVEMLEEALAADY